MGRRPQGGWAQGKFQSPGSRASSKASPKARDEEEETGIKGGKGKIVISDAYKCKKCGKNDQILTCTLETIRPRDLRVVSFDFKSNFMS